MTTQTFTILPQGTYPVGTRTLPAANVPQGAISATLALSRAQWLDPAVKVSARFELSVDGGVTWSPDPSGQSVWPWGNFPLTFESEGDPSGRGTSNVNGDLGDPTNPNRKIRGTVTISGGPLTTIGTLTVTS
jgi:hypothetical protein